MFGGGIVIKNKLIIASILLVLIMITLNTASAEDPTNTIYIDNQTNNQIQEIIDTAENGSTIIFNSNQYTNLNLIINHSINIKNNQSTIYSNTSQPVFTIINTNNVTIENFNINSTSDAIFAQNSRNIGIYNNNISSKSTGINLNRILYANIIHNTLTKNNNSAITITQSYNIQISNNTITDTTKDGIILQGSNNNINITNNQLLRNGIYTNYAINLISTNNLDKQNNIYIYNNNITDNGNGINVNVATNKLNITENAIVRGAKGVNLDQGYRKTDTALYIDYNAFVQGSDLCIDARGSIYEQVGGIRVGYNWFNRNNNNGFICPKVSAGILQSNIRQIGDNTYQVYFTADGNEVNTLANFNLRVKVNGKIGYSSITNGQGTFTIPGDVGSSSNVIIGDNEDLTVTVKQYNKPSPKPNNNNPSDNSGNSSTSGSGSGGSVSPSTTNGQVSSQTGSVSSSSVSASSSSSSAESTSEVVKTLTYDEDSFRVIGIPGLLILILLAILIYYNEDIKKAIKK